MSIERTDYIVYGWKLPFDLKDSKTGESIDFFDDKFLPMIEGHLGEKYIIVVDGMCGEYVVFGLLLMVSSGDGWNFDQLNFTTLNSDEVKTKFKEVFDVDDVSDPYLYFHIFHNYERTRKNRRITR